MTVQHEIEVSSQVEANQEAENESVCNFVDAHCQCNLSESDKFGVEKFQTHPSAIHYYTGFEDFEHFMFFFHCLGPASYDLNFKCKVLTPEDQLFLTLMKLRQAKEDIELSILFNISESTVSKIVITWINFLYHQLKELDIWPSREIIDEHMPDDFARKYPATRVILDATEIPIAKPSNVDAQSMTWSTYKHKNTLKTMVGCSPRGVITYVSESYGGSASDRQIIEDSDLVDQNSKMFVSGDSIMADRGIMVQDLFAPRDVHVNTPTMLKGKSQLYATEVVRDRRIASKRIHVERLIGLCKKFKILCTPLLPSKVLLGSRIVFVCFSITNFRKCIVDQTA